MGELFTASLPFFYFLFVAAITPGPNNIMLTASGMNFGYKKTIPHMFGIYFGFTVLLMLCALGVGVFYNAYPPIQIILKGGGTLFLLYLVYRICTAGRLGLNDQRAGAARPITFWEAAGFQFINPKSVVFSLAASSLLPAAAGHVEIIFIVGATTIISCWVSMNCWVLFGKVVAQLFRNDRVRNVINIILGLLLLATVPMIWL